MPKKPSTDFVMQDYPALPSRRWPKLAVRGVCRTSKGSISFELSVLDDPKQSGRVIIHDVPAVLAPNSPLHRFLEDGFGIRLARGEHFDMATLVDRVLLARFSKAQEGNDQTIAAIKACEQSAQGQHAAPAKSAAQDQEAASGLG